MTGISAVVRVEHPDIVLTETVSRDRSSTVRSVSEAGTDPTAGKFFYHIESADFQAFEDGLGQDPTIRAFERVVETSDQRALYSFEYAERAKVLTPIVTAANGVILDMENDGSTWLLTIWLPERSDLDQLWAFAHSHDIDIELLRLSDHQRFGESAGELTESQREALRVAFEQGYFEEPREATLSEVAAELGISQPAAGGLLRRGTKQLVTSCLLNGEDGTE